MRELAVQPCSRLHHGEDIGLASEMYHPVLRNDLKDAKACRKRSSWICIFDSAVFSVLEKCNFEQIIED